MGYRVLSTECLAAPTGFLLAFSILGVKLFSATVLGEFFIQIYMLSIGAYIKNGTCILQYNARKNGDFCNTHGFSMSPNESESVTNAVRDIRGPLSEDS